MRGLLRTAVDHALPRIALPRNGGDLDSPLRGMLRRAADQRHNAKTGGDGMEQAKLTRIEPNKAICKTGD